MKHTIYIYTKFDKLEKDSLSTSLGINNTIYFHDELLENMQFDTFAQCDICLGNVPIKWCLAENNLKWLQLHSAGIDPYNTLVNPAFLITNLRGYFAESVAETTLAGILAFYRGIDRLALLQSNNQWVGNIIRSTLQKLSRKNVWILGGGSIASKFIELIDPFKCNIIQSGLRVLKTNAHSIEYFTERAKMTDIIVLILPEIPELTHYFNAERLSLLNANTLIVNTGRGSTIDTEALKEVLAKNAIHGAVLDVTEIEPVPENDTLWKMPNVILTQHSAGGWDDENIGKVNFFKDQLAKFDSNADLENVVDCERGY